MTQNCQCPTVYCFRICTIIDFITCEIISMIAYRCEKAALKTRIRQSRRRIGHSNDLMALSRLAIDRSREAIRSSSTRFAPAWQEPKQAVSVGAVQTLLADMNGEALDAVVEDFSAAYREAVATGNDEAADIVRKALVILGRHLANSLGPKAAGVSIN
ncbi:hypothetical protein MKK64_00725 [Methylobacterium sp. E-025]|uniref:hypothetical protein n=1 Tax=Methylobacterium sp. E-025 TaxID=2836561 RepID=UPI001FBB20AD|nr:hypothetical protein [Methylobacterium sp. E-025]MCJ2109748.1 hypothetical protein [Methylobacterium sp. E-025]